MKYICLLTPHAPPEHGLSKGLISLDQNTDVVIHHVHLKDGPALGDDNLDRALWAARVVACAKQAEKAGAHAIIINSMLDPGLDETRMAVKIPVLGIGVTSMNVAASFGQKFSFISDEYRDQSSLENYTRACGFHDRIASSRFVKIPHSVGNNNFNPSSPEIQTIENLYDYLAAEAHAAITEDNASALILNNSGFLGTKSHILKYLAARTIYSVPVIDAMTTTIDLLANTAFEAKL